MVRSNPEHVHLKAVLITTPRHSAREAKCAGTDNQFNFALRSLRFLSCESIFSWLFNDVVGIETV
jgi:hypothetical protein